MIRRSRHFLTAALLAVFAVAFVATPAGAATNAPAWRVESHAAPSYFVPDLTTGQDMYVITATNRGGATTDGSEITITDELPAGFIPQPDPSIFGGTLKFGVVTEGLVGPTIPCSPGPPVTCKITQKIVSGERIVAWVPVQAPASGPATVTNQVTVSGGGAPPASVSEQTPFNTDPVPFGIQHLDTSLVAADGSPETQAGAHPLSRSR